MIKRLGIYIRSTGGFGLLHDSRKDVRSLATICSELIDKVNELVDEVNHLKEVIKELEK